MCMRSGLVIRTIPSIRTSRNSDLGKGHGNSLHQPSDANDHRPRSNKYKSTDFLSVVTRYQMMCDSPMKTSYPCLLNATVSPDMKSQNNGKG